MAGYTKLFSSIVHSTIWREPDHVRLVWITMLAIADKTGNVEASIPGLADLARVSISDCEDALARLYSPDKYSRSVENEGRRIADSDGGWVLLNHEKYRDALTGEAARIRNAGRQSEYRKRKKERAGAVKNSNAEVTEDNATVTPRSKSVTPPAPAPTPTASPTASASPSATPDPTPEKTQEHAPARDQDQIQETNTKGTDFDQFWESYPRKTGKASARKSFKAALKSKDDPWPGIETVVKIVESLADSQDWRKEGGKFVPMPSTWLNQARWADETDTRGDLEKALDTPFHRRLRAEAAAYEAEQRGEVTDVEPN